MFYSLTNLNPKSQGPWRQQNLGSDFKRTIAAMNCLFWLQQETLLSDWLIDWLIDFQCPYPSSTTLGKNIKNGTESDCQHLALFLGGSKLRLSRLVQHAVIWTLELKRNKQTNNNDQWAFNLTEPGKKPCFNTENFSMRPFACPQKPTDLFLETSVTVHTPTLMESRWVKGTGKRETGKDKRAGQPASVKSPVGLTWKRVQVMYSVSHDSY